MFVWDGEGDGKIQFDAESIGEQSLGHIVEQRAILISMMNRLQTHENIEFICPARPTRLINVGTHITLDYDDGKILQTKLLIGADGANSWVREQVGIKVNGWDYQHHAIVSTVETEQPHQKTASQRFMPRGPLAFLPLADPHKCSIVWSTQPEHAKTLLNMNTEDFNDALGEAFEFHLGKIISTSKRFSFPLRMLHAKQYVKPRVALLGDAAHVVHPLAGQGVNLGFADAECLGKILIETFKQGREMGALAPLRRYERARKGHNVSMIATMEAFKRLFGTNNTLLTTIRNWGLNATHRATPIKNQIIRKAMGL